MDKVICINIIGCLPKQFDSHDFIRKFIYKYKKKYNQLVAKYSRLNIVHSVISNFLRNNAKTLGIEYKGKTVSENIPEKCLPAPFETRFEYSLKIIYI